MYSLFKVYKFQITCSWYTMLLRFMFYLRSATGQEIWRAKPSGKTYMYISFRLDYSFNHSYWLRNTLKQNIYLCANIIFRWDIPVVLQ
jgi:hypothetical protein